MLKNWRFATLIFLAIVVAILTADWALARARLPGISIETVLETPEVIADGNDTATFVVRVTENGQPRADDLLQIWLVKGTGQLIPKWAFTDEQGEARVAFTPAPYNRYDPQDVVEIAIMDTNIGRLIEVGKNTSIEIPLVIPTTE
jgi:hypothetical protein